MSVSVVTTTITPEIARGWLDELVWNVELSDDAMQRRYKPSWASHLAQQMRQGLFDPTTQIGIAVLNGTGYLVNGQHTANAIIQSEVPITLAVATHTAKTIDEIAAIYTHYDAGRGRNWGDRLNAYSLEHSTGVPKSYVKKLGSAISHIAAGFGQSFNMRSKVDTSQWIKPFKAYAPLFVLLNDGLDCKRDIRNKLMGAPVLSVALVTIAGCPDKALPFWKRLAADDGLRKGDPAKRLHDFLAYEMRREGGYGVGLNHRLISKVVAHCWNCEYQDRPLTNLRFKSIFNKPLSIKGTPYSHIVEPWKINEDTGKLTFII